jgi:hypothetical protein
MGSVAALLLTEAPVAAPRATATTVLGPFTGHHAPLHPDNIKPQQIRYYGTDLGWSYAHQGRLQFLFGDTFATENGDLIDPLYDDGFGTIDLAEWPDAARISATNLPRIRLGQQTGSTQMSSIHPGHPMEGLKTPVGAFSNGTREFALFVTSKPAACSSDAQCPNGLTCDTGLGFIGEPPAKDAGLTLACVDGTPGCNADTMFEAGGKPQTPSGLCLDTTSTLWARTEFGRTGATAMKQLVSVRSTTDPQVYTTSPQRWLTNKFINVAVRTVADFAAERGVGRANQNYRPAQGAGAKQRVFLWGRPWFIGVNKSGRTVGLYFAYVDMPRDADLTWRPQYFAGLDAQGRPRFSTNEKEAIAVDLDAKTPGIQPTEPYDMVGQMSIVWIEPLRKWVMFYGGGTTKVPIPGLAPNCGVLEVLTRSECKNVEIGNGALRMRTADDPWGPWSDAQDLIAGGNPDRRPVEGQFAPGGVLHHPACVGPKCETRTPRMAADDYGCLYGPNIIEQWTRPAGKGIDVIWNASTWNPYRVILLRTHIEP